MLNSVFNLKIPKGNKKGTMKYPLNQNYSSLTIAKGNNLFIYFSYSIWNKRKVITYKKGLNDKGITATERKQRIKKLFNEIEHLLYTKVFNGTDFTELKKDDEIQLLHNLQMLI